MLLATFLGVHSNSKEVSYLSWQNIYPNLKTTCHIKLKFFLWTKPLHKFLLANYLICTAHLSNQSNKFFMHKNFRRGEKLCFVVLCFFCSVCNLFFKNSLSWKPNLLYYLCVLQSTPLWRIYFSPNLALVFFPKLTINFFIKFSTSFFTVFFSPSYVLIFICQNIF